MIPLDPFHNETTPEGDVGAAGAPEGDTGQQGGAPEWLDSPEFAEAVQHYAGQAAESQIQNLLASLDNGQGGPQFDPLADNAAEQIQAMIRAEVQPFQQFTEEARYSEGEGRALDIIASLETDGGEFLGRAAEGEQLAVDSRMVARQLGDSFYPEAAARYGDGPRAAEAALSKAVEVVRALEQAVGKNYANREQNQLHTLAGARREPSAAGTTGAGEVRAGVSSEQDLVRQFFPR